MNIHEYAYFNGEFVKAADAKVNVMTHAFMYGTAVFEGIRAYWNPEKEKLYVLKAKEHFERMIKSCKIMRIKPSLTVDEMMNIMIELLQKNAPHNDAYIRPSWYKGSLRIGPNLIGPDNSEDHFVLNTIDLGDYLDTEKGISVSVSSWRRVSDNAIPARAKINGSYVNTGLAKATAHEAGYDDSIFLNEDGSVSEGSAMNLFLIRDGKLITPSSTDNILEGITRSLVMQIAREDLGLEAESRKIDRTELYIADEAFFCGTGAQIAPIGKIDGYELGDTKAGEITKQIQSIYFDICRGNNPKYKDCVIEVDVSSAKV